MLRTHLCICPSLPILNPTPYPAFAAPWLLVGVCLGGAWHVIRQVDTTRRTVKLEPGVTVGQVTRFLNPRGWTLEVTLEVADATVGGLCIAVGMTTHSHRAGLMQETVQAYDVVTADGSLLHCTVRPLIRLSACTPACVPANILAQ